jgi:hypothetical protein
MNSSLAPFGPRVRNSLIKTDGKGVGEAVGDGEGVGRGVGVGDGEGLGDGVGVGTGVGLGEGFGEGLGVGVGEGPGVGTLARFCGSLGATSRKSFKLSLASSVLPRLPPGFRSYPRLLSVVRGAR